jgi:hypothetical protein
MTGEMIRPADRVIPATQIWFAPAGEEPPGAGLIEPGSTSDPWSFTPDEEEATVNDLVGWGGEAIVGTTRTWTVELDEEASRAIRELFILPYDIPPSRRDRRHPPTPDRAPLDTEKHYPTSTHANGARRRTRRTA